MLLRTAAVAGSCLIATAVHAQATASQPSSRERPTMAAARRTAPVAIDGRLNDAAWLAAQPATGFVQRDPVEGAPASVRTEVRVLFDDHALYVGARMFDPEPQTIARQLVRRDDTGQADWFAVGFDPRMDQRTAWAFIVSAANVQADIYLYNDENEDGAWDAVWESAVAIDSLGWTAELRIPLSQLRYDAGRGPQSWGVNFARHRVRNNEETHFALMSRLRQGQVSQFGTMTGIEITRAPQRVELRPYALTSAVREPVEIGNPFHTGTSQSMRAGLDARYGLGSSFTLDATVNPDFGQVEADPAVINLSAFETFFEERRPFFVQDAQIFNFQLSGHNNQLFYGRRVGRSPTGGAPAGADFADVPDAASILGAAKLTGRTAGGLSVGAIAALTDAARGRAWFGTPGPGEMRSFLAEPRAGHGAVRFKQDFADGASTIGVIGTAQRRDLPADGSFDALPRAAYSGGVDWEHQWNDRTYAFFGYLAGSHVAGDSTAMIRIQRASNHSFQRPDALRLRVDSGATSLQGLDWRMTVEKRRGEHWTGSVWAAQVTPGFEINDLGFSGRQEVLDGGARVSYREITPGSVLRSYRVSLYTFHNWTHDALEDRWSARSWSRSHVAGSVSLNADVTLLNYWDIGMNVSWRPELADRNATRGGPMMTQPRSVEWRANLTTDGRRRVVFGSRAGVERRALGAGGGESFSLGVAVRPSPRVEASIEPAWEQRRDGAQYVSATSVLPYAPTYGARYLFADLERREFSLETRLNVTFSPLLSLQLYAQPLLSSGDYLTYKQLAAPHTYVFDPFAEGTWVAGTPGTCVGGRTCPNMSGDRLFDFDGDGAVDYTTRDRDFNVRSLVGNLVLRWEYRPGSTLFFVWQRQQEDRAAVGRFDFSNDARALLGAPAHNVFMIKASYWFGL